jgi:hypothetical protein
MNLNVRTAQTSTLVRQDVISKQGLKNIYKILGTTETKQDILNTL